MTDQLQDAHAELRRGTNGAPYAVAWYPVMVIQDNTRRARITGWTEAVVPLEPLLARQRRLAHWLVLAGVTALLLGSSLTHYLCGLWLRPWRAVAASARELKEGALSGARIPAVTDDADLARVVEVFNALLDRLKASEARQQQFVADAAHELRTPLAALRAEIEVALRRPRSSVEYEQTLQLNRLELERLGGLVENLLALARIEVEGPRSACAPTNLADANAVRVAVHDQGVGIAPEHLPRLFDRFYRVDTARNRAHGGAGLGLAIVKTIAEAHGGGVKVESALGKGSTFTLRLPRRPPPP
jgi:signal transduction histidine kinase